MRHVFGCVDCRPAGRPDNLHNRSIIMTYFCIFIFFFSQNNDNKVNVDANVNVANDKAEDNNADPNLGGSQAKASVDAKTVAEAKPKADAGTDATLDFDADVNAGADAKANAKVKENVTNNNSSTAQKKNVADGCDATGCVAENRHNNASVYVDHAERMKRLNASLAEANFVLRVMKRNLRQRVAENEALKCVIDYFRKL